MRGELGVALISLTPPNPTLATKPTNRTALTLHTAHCTLTAIYDPPLLVVSDSTSVLRPLLAQIERRDRDLGRQLRRASSSVALNLAEGMYSRGELRTARYHTALGSMRESFSCLEVAHAFGYVHALDSAMRNRVNRIIGSLVRLVKGKR